MAPRITVNPEAFQVAFTAEEIKRAGVKVYEKAMISAKSRLDTLTYNWSTSVQFKSSVSLVGNKIVAIMETDSLPFIYVDKGVEPHRITARNKEFLSFLVGPEAYIPRTKVGSFRSGQSKKQGDLIRIRSVKKHPGIQARGWSEILEKYISEFVTELLNDNERRMADFARTRKPKRIWVKGKWISPKTST